MRRWSHPCSYHLARLLHLGARLQYPIQIAHWPWLYVGGMPDSSLPAGDGPGGVGGDTGRGAGAWPASP
jgi:hypothetical protein